MLLYRLLLRAPGPRRADVAGALWWVVVLVLGTSGRPAYGQVGSNLTITAAPLSLGFKPVTPFSTMWQIKLNEFQYIDPVGELRTLNGSAPSLYFASDEVSPHRLAKDVLHALRVVARAQNEATRAQEKAKSGQEKAKPAQEKAKPAQDQATPASDSATPSQNQTRAQNQTGTPFHPALYYQRLLQPACLPCRVFLRRKRRLRNEFLTRLTADVEAAWPADASGAPVLRILP